MAVGQAPISEGEQSERHYFINGRRVPAVGAAISGDTNGQFVNAELIQAKDQQSSAIPGKDVSAKDASHERLPLKHLSTAAELDQFLCEMCNDIPPPCDSFLSRVNQLFRTVFWKVGFGWETPKVAENVKSLHDVVARLLIDAEVVRASREWAMLSTVTREDLCFPLSLLAGRCVLIVNVATQ